MTAVRRRVWVVVVLCCLVATAAAQGKLEPRPERLPQDQGRAGLQQMFVRLRTTARLMHVTAHPDDEDGGLLTLQTRGRGVSVALLTLTRGEGGQNKLGASLSDELGVLRTLELLESDRYYGVQQRFTRVADFGYSKSAEETFRKWGGKELALEDMVMAIRAFQPDVIVCRFSGTRRDGHGHHEATGVLAPEAFRAAADPNRFPQQLKMGLQPWQAKKFYAGVRGGTDWSVQYNTGEGSPVLGMSYVQFAVEGLHHQLSQGAGEWKVGEGPRYSSYKLISVAAGLPPPVEGKKEEDFFSGQDVTLAGLASRLGADEPKVPWLRAALQEIAAKVDEAEGKAKQNIFAAAEPLLAGARLSSAIEERIFLSSLPDAAKRALHLHLLTKREQFEEAAQIASGVRLHVVATAPDGTVSGGEPLQLKASFESDDPAAVHLADVRPLHPQQWRAEVRRDAAGATIQLHAPARVEATRWHFRRADPLRDSRFEADDALATLPLRPAPIGAIARYRVGAETGTVRAEAVAETSSGMRTLVVAPAITLEMESGIRVVPTGASGAFAVGVAVSKRVGRPGPVAVQLTAPQGWRASAPQTVELKDGERRKLDFQLSMPEGQKEGEFKVHAIASFEGQRFSESMKVVSREDLASYPHLFPAEQRINVVDVRVPPIKVGYVMGAGDEIPTVLRQAGLDVNEITPQELAGGDLSRYATIVLGIRAYDTRPDVRQHNRRLLQFVDDGGTLVVQYNASMQEMNSGNFTPRPVQFGRERVSAEDAPVKVLKPEDPLFRTPNLISARDFEGWVQERGLYFASQWDDSFEPLLESNDPGEAPLRGGLLRARHGKGTYIYTGYAFFRQLPAGVPGAIRLFVNLVSARADAAR